MNDEQIKALLRELSDKAVYEGKSETVRIVLDPKEERRPSRKIVREDTEETGLHGEETARESIRTDIPEEPTDDETDSTDSEDTGRRNRGKALAEKGAGLLTGLAGAFGEIRKKRQPKERVFADIKVGEETAEEAEEAAEAEDAAVSATAAEGAKETAETQEDDALRRLLHPKRIREILKKEPEEAEEEESGEDAETETEDEFIDEDEEDTADAEASSNDRSETSEAAEEFIPARKKKRVTPVEPADFESDAYLFRSSAEDDETEPETPAFLKKAGAGLAGVFGALAGKAEAGKAAARKRAEAKAKAKAEKAELAAEKAADDAELAADKAAEEAVKETAEGLKAEVAEEIKEAAETKEAEEIAETEEAVKEEAAVTEQKTVKEAAEETTEAADEDTKALRIDDFDEEDPVAPKGKALSGIMNRLAHKGIKGHELFMIAGGAILLILLLALILSSMTGRKKAENVTAEDGLRVLVEEQPDAWTKKAEVELSIRAASPIQSISVNGENVEFSGEKKTSIRVEADQPKLEVMVVSEDKVRSAEVEVPMIDSEAPTLDISIEGDTVTLNAEDSQSGLAGVYYGTLEGFFNTPLYTAYSGPFKAEEGKKYCIYALDNAGNMYLSEPAKMVAATGLTIASETMALFPGETGDLGLTMQPAGAMTSNLTLVSSDEEVATVSKSGIVTAVADGSAQITASADGLASVSCVVTVRSEAQITVTTLGDMTLGSDQNFSPQNSFDTVASMYGVGYFMQNVKDVLAQDDLTFANFEGTLTTQGTRLDKQYAFRGDPSYTQILTDGSIDSVTLANNHSHDYGEVSLEDTKQYLTNAGIDYCIGTETIVKEVKGVKVGLIGIYTLDEQDEEAQLHEAMEDVKNRGAQVIIVAFHWGTETYTTPDEMQIAIAHEAVDLGADLVVGHHPHVLQGIELYNGKYIAYSLGNFCFGGNTNPTTLDSMIFRETFTIGAGGEVSDTSIEIIPITISSSMSWNNYQPTLAEGDRAESIMNNIRQLSSDLGTDLGL